MGACNVDLTKQTRKYTETYSLSSAAGVKALLRDRHRIAARRFKGDTAASDILIDLHSAINSAGLTDRQTEALAWVYGADITLEKAGEIMGCTKQGVKAFVDGAAGRIADVFKRWEYGEIAVEIEAEGDGAEDE
ncbi:RNA polymerase subunit sigma [Paenibacillus sp. J5C_2022]|uniref:RNA polymerase subunit sigma n=1 Tax=Paenibacillus sp. J5C2022 TaxID=2977129 RepID=UPI0021CFA044|nr:RNA polymerase subunit sigma [Paenibacillus sp. J5C2022]MCU6709331.1 RNA polymerase subunit sigma [Paenibacillus sp. J5C2022]